MSCLYLASSKPCLTPTSLKGFLDDIQQKLSGRVEAAYTFGSASTGEYRHDSDIDLILVKSSVDKIFVYRALEFVDLHEIYPALDILVYTSSELTRQLEDSAIGFWKSVRLSMRQIL